jgi:hypothetical protein
VSNVVEMFPAKATFEEDPLTHCPEVFFECYCGNRFFYLTPYKNTYALICHLCGEEKEWNEPC